MLFASKNFLTNNNDNFAKGDKGADSGVDSNSVFFSFFVKKSFFSY